MLSPLWGGRSGALSDRVGEGLRTAAGTGRASGLMAGVRKPPKDERAGSSCAMGIWQKRRERDGATARSGGYVHAAASRMTVSREM